MLKYLGHPPIDSLFPTLRDLNLALVALGDTRDLIPDRLTQRRHFGAQVPGGLMIRTVTRAPFDLLVLVIEELLPKLGDHGIAERVGHRWVGDIEIIPGCPLSQDMRYPF